MEHVDSKWNFIAINT